MHLMFVRNIFCTTFAISCAKDQLGSASIPPENVFPAYPLPLLGMGNRGILPAKCETPTFKPEKAGYNECMKGR